MEFKDLSSMINKIEELEKEALTIWENPDYQLRSALDNIIMISRREVINRDDVVEAIFKYMELKDNS